MYIAVSSTAMRTAIATGRYRLTRRLKVRPSCSLENFQATNKSPMTPAPKKVVILTSPARQPATSISEKIAGDGVRQNLASAAMKQTEKNKAVDSIRKLLAPNRYSGDSTKNRHSVFASVARPVISFTQCQSGTSVSSAKIHDTRRPLWSSEIGSRLATPRTMP